MISTPPPSEPDAQPLDNDRGDATMPLPVEGPPQVTTIPEASKELAKLSQSERKSLKRYREKLRASLSETETLRAKLQEKCDQLEATVSEARSLTGEIEGHSISGAAIVEQINVLHSEAESVLTRIGQMRPQLDLLIEHCDAVAEKAETAATQCKHINDGFEYAKRMRPVVEEAVEEVKAAVAESGRLLETAQTREGRLQAAEENAIAAANSATELEASTDQVAKRLVKAENQLADAMSGLATQSERAESLADTIERLLPGATSAGLASSFSNRAGEFKKPVVIWECVAVASLVGLASLAFMWSEQLVPSDPAVQLTQYLLLLVGKAIVATPLVWLAVYSARKAGVARRVGEDYEFKAALATSFEGYKQQLEGIESDDDAPLLQLCRDVLTNLAMQPGRLYDAKHQDVTPLTMVAEAIGGITKGRKGKVKTAAGEAEVSDTSE